MAAQAPESDAEYEYKTLQVNRKEFNNELGESLTDLAADGWNVVETVRTTNHTVGVILRRER